MAIPTLPAGWEFRDTPLAPNKLIVRPATEQYIVLTNRPFDGMDSMHKHRMLAVITEAVQRAAGKIVQFVDVGGGSESAYARGVSGHPLFAGRVEASNIDLIAHDTQPMMSMRDLYDQEKYPADFPCPDGPVRVFREDFLEAPLDTLPRADVMWSQQVSRYCVDRSAEFLDRCAALLNPEGVGYIDYAEGFMTYWDGLEPVDFIPGDRAPLAGLTSIQRIADRHGVYISAYTGAEDLYGKASNITAFDGKYLKMTKTSDAGFAQRVGFPEEVLFEIAPYMLQRQYAWGKLGFF